MQELSRKGKMVTNLKLSKFKKKGPQSNIIEEL